MPELDLLPILVGSVAALILGATYYTVFAVTGEDEQPAPWKLLVELGRCLVLTAVVAGLASQGEIDTWSGGLLLGAALWLGFPAVLWAGAIVSVW